ncbi:drug/metabolite transporter (DMT)-like permease [Cytobacillus eiseniae]|uniref:Drug/metabolite transporter (DMT)-like permease n=1 Tax=Cytobacillus eiseniae TaxID=762947 RepID=A0ABS4RB88_9BACI|nr:DMT family transporter [Cytobacillus eiseniae]MBP2239651.1 drug/metabolite transporter (DMT)-like permease [Cytobacillus eiseniae]
MKKQRIYFILFFVMIAWGFNVTATKVLVENFMPVTMTALRIFVSGMSVFFILFIMKKVRLLTKKEFIYVFFGGLFNVVAHQYYLSTGLTQTTATNGGLILGLGPLLTAILSVIFLGSVLTSVRVAGIVMGIAGVSIIVFQGSGGIDGVSVGDVYIFISILAQAASFILIKKVSETLDPRLMTGYMLIMGAVILFFISLFKEPEGIASMANDSVGLWVVFFASAIIATAIGHMLYNGAIGKVGAAEASMFLNLNPFFALVGAAIFLGENIEVVHILGFILILFGVVLGSGAFEEIYRKVKRKQNMPIAK